MKKLKVLSGSPNWIDDDVQKWAEENHDYSVESYKVVEVDDKVVIVLAYEIKEGIEL